MVYPLWEAPEEVLSLRAIDYEAGKDGDSFVVLSSSSLACLPLPHSWSHQLWSVKILPLSPTDLPDTQANCKRATQRTLATSYILTIELSLLSFFLPGDIPFLTTSPLVISLLVFLFNFLFCFASNFVYHHLNWKPHSGLIF